MSRRRQFGPAPTSLHFFLLPLLGLAVIAAACGGDSGSPSAPSSNTSSVTVTLSSPLRMGQTTQASGTATLSNGQTQPITTGWLSDQPGVATVTTAGLVSGISNGQATIYVISGGRQGQQVLRVVPDYQGRWNGGMRVKNCTQTGVFASIDFCGEFPVGSTYGYALALSQSGEVMTATLDYGGGAVFPSVAAPIQADGTAAFTATLLDSSEGFAITLDANLQINSARVGELTGTATDVWRVPGASGEVRLTQDLVQTTRTGTTARTAGESVRSRLSRGLRRLDGSRP